LLWFWFYNNHLQTSLRTTGLCLSLLHEDRSNADSRPENLQVPSAIADFVHQERIKGQAGLALNRYA